MPAYLERLNKYDGLTDAEKKTFRMWMTDLMPTGVDYKFHCEPLSFNLPESFIELWQKYPENPAPHLPPLESLNQWRNKIADELSMEKIGYLPPTERLIRYGSLNGKRFNTLLMDLQALSTKEFKGINFELPEMYIEIWRNHPENFETNADPMITLTEYCKRVNDEIRNPDKYNETKKDGPVLSELSSDKKEALRAAPPKMQYPTHSFLNTAAFQYDVKERMQEAFAQSPSQATIKDYALVRATNNLTIQGYHVPINPDTRISTDKSFLGPEVASFEYSEIKNFALNGLTLFGSEWESMDYNIIEPLEDQINSPTLKSLHPGDTFFDVKDEPLPVSQRAIYLIPEARYKVLMQNPEIAIQLADKNVVVFRGNARDAVDMQLCKMGIVPYSVRGDVEIDELNGTAIGKKFTEGLESISEGIGKPGLERVMYKKYCMIEQSQDMIDNLNKSAELKVKNKKEFFEFFFEQNPSVSKQREKLIEIVERDFKLAEEELGKDNVKRFENDIYENINGEGEQADIVSEIYDILGEDRVNETIKAYNEKVRAAFMERYSRFVSELPENKSIPFNSEQPIEEYIGINVSEGTEAIGNHVKTKTGIYRDIGSQIPLSSITEYAKDMGELFTRVEDAQSQNTSTSKLHGIQHVKNVLLLSNYIGLMNGVSSHDLDLIREAAIYHDISHEQAGDSTHAKKGANWYLENVESVLDKEEVAFLIEAHEVEGKRNLGDLVKSIFPNITEQRKAELIRCAEVLQDADKLDILRYDIEKPNYQRFIPSRLNIKQSSELISAVIELNTRQAINKGFLSIKDGEIVQNQNDTINPSQIGSETSRAGIGLVDINQTTRGMRDSLSPDKVTTKGEEPRN